MGGAQPPFLRTSDSILRMNGDERSWKRLDGWAWVLDPALAAVDLRNGDPRGRADRGRDALPGLTGPRGWDRGRDDPDRGHLRPFLKEPLYDTTHHIFPGLVLLTFVLAAPAERDLLSCDA
jgi:hypothetical protein